MLPKRDFKYVKHDPETPRTQLVIVVGLLVVAAVFDTATPAYIALAVGLVSLVIPVVGIAIVWGWYKLAELMSRIVNPVVLGLMYFVFITPIAFLFRMFGNDPLSLDKPKGSLYDYHEKTYQPADLENPW